MGYQGAEFTRELENLGYKLIIVKRPRKWFWVHEKEELPFVPSFTKLPKRWVAERTFAWLNKYRPLSKDYEYLIDTSHDSTCLYTPNAPTNP